MHIFEILNVSAHSHFGSRQEKIPLKLSFLVFVKDQKRLVINSFGQREINLNCSETKLAFARSKKKFFSFGKQIFGNKAYVEKTSSISYTYQELRRQSLDMA